MSDKCTRGHADQPEVTISRVDKRIQHEVRREAAHPLHGALSRRESDPIKLAYDLMSAG